MSCYLIIPLQQCRIQLIVFLLPSSALQHTTIILYFRYHSCNRIGVTERLSNCIDLCVKQIRLNFGQFGRSDIDDTPWPKLWGIIYEISLRNDIGLWVVTDRWWWVTGPTGVFMYNNIIASFLIDDSRVNSTSTSTCNGCC
jgi:hypothetical protein